MPRKIKNRWDEKWAHPEVIEDDIYRTLYNTDPRIILEKTAEELEEERIEFKESFREAACAANPSMEWKDYYMKEGCPEEPDAPEIHIMAGVPKKRKAGKKLPAAFCITGGGLTGGGTAEVGILSTSGIVMGSKIDMVHICFEYRIAPANTYPAAINDCHAAYLWMLEHAEELQINTDKIVICGGSSGGHLALSFTFRLKRYNWCGAPMPRGVIAQVPVVDDVAFTNSSLFSFESPETHKVEGWDGLSSKVAFKLWLGDRYGDTDLPPEAVPGRATLEDVKGYPPVWIPCEAEFESGRDTMYRFVQLLHEADIFCDYHVWGGTSHLSYDGGNSDFGQRLRMIAGGALRDAVTYDFRRPWLNEE